MSSQYLPAWMAFGLGRAGSIRGRGGTFRSGRIGKEPFGSSPFPERPSSSDLASSESRSEFGNLVNLMCLPAAWPLIAAASLAGPSFADRSLPERVLFNFIKPNYTLVFITHL